MLFRTSRSLRCLGELGYDITLKWIPSYVGIRGNKRADVLANEGSFFGTLFQNQARLTTVNTSDIPTQNGRIDEMTARWAVIAIR
jgi:hypothetical protein